MWCWGLNNEGQLGNGDVNKDDSLVPVQVVGSGGAGFLTDVVVADGGQDFTCVSLSDGTAWCWGRNHNNQLGDNSGTDQLTPVQVVGPGGVGFLGDVQSVTAQTTLDTACATLSDGTVYCWGQSLGGLLKADSLVPLEVVGLSGVASGGLGKQFSCAVLSDGTMWCWGLNNEGQLGDGTKDESLTPVQVAGAGGVGSLTDVVAVDGGEKFACAARTDGTAWCWGKNDNNVLGDNSDTDQLTPVQVVGPGGVGFLGDVQSVAAEVRLDTVCATLSDGTARCWGDIGETEGCIHLIVGEPRCKALDTPEL
jgi:alpha-tubulin suppressor-like RCC1 family protein